jgi:hypothetical protein
VAERSELVDAADDAFADGIRAALLVGLVLAALVLLAGAKVFPRGHGTEVVELDESRDLAVSEAAPQAPG